MTLNDTGYTFRQIDIDIVLNYLVTGLRSGNSILQTLASIAEAEREQVELDAVRVRGRLTAETLGRFYG